METLLLDRRTSGVVQGGVPAGETLSSLVRFFSVFSDATRLRILSALAISEMCVTDLSRVLAINQTTVSHQLRHLKDSFPDAAVTLSFGEWPEPLYAEWKEAGADRYLLRHETATAGHFARLHPAGQTLEHRLSCLQALRRLGYQTGAGFMVGSPFQSEEDVARDLAFLSSFRPEMAGIGPFIPHHDTVFASCGAGSVDDTLFILALIRIAMPNVLLPATTALATLSPTGTRDGILAGANVVMPNMTPAGEGRYELYDGKKRQDAGEAIRKEIEAAGCRMAMVRGDYRD